MLLSKVKLEKGDINNAVRCFDYAIEIASKLKDGEMTIYTITNIYELLEKNGLGDKFVNYLELKGIYKRFNQHFYSYINEAVNDIYNFIIEDIEENEYAIYGHIMGNESQSTFFLGL